MTAVTFKDFFTNHVLPNEAQLSAKQAEWQTESTKCVEICKSFKEYAKCFRIFRIASILLVSAHAFLRGSTLFHVGYVALAVLAFPIVARTFDEIAQKHNMQKCGFDYLSNEIELMKTEKANYKTVDDKFPSVPNGINQLDIFVIMQSLRQSIKKTDKNANKGIFAVVTAKQLDGFIASLEA